MAARKLDIFDALRAIDSNNATWLEAQPVDAQKEFAPSVVMRWASGVAQDGVEAEVMLDALNRRVNHRMWDLSGYPDLLWRLLASCGIGGSLRREWLPLNAKKSKIEKLYSFLETLYPEANSFEIDMLLRKYTRMDFVELVNCSGNTPDDTKDLIKIYDMTFGKTDDAAQPEAKKSRKKR